MGKKFVNLSYWKRRKIRISLAELGRPRFWQTRG